MILNDLEGWNLDVSVPVFESFNLAEYTRVVSLRDPAEADEELVFFLKFVESSIKSLFLLKEEPVDL
jgi:hypothetical protein